MPLRRFHPIIADWFHDRFGVPTEIQARSWPAIASGDNVLIAAPTGSGKTLAAFLSCLDGLFKQALARDLDDRTQILYVSPLKALSNDVQKNLQQPLAEIAERALAAGLLLPEIRVTVRTGDTPVADRQQMLRRPPHILITTPESLYLLLTADKSRRILKDIRTVIVDEIHAVAPNKRGAHLALSLERLAALVRLRPVRIGLSATQRPIRTISAFLVGARPSPVSPAGAIPHDPSIVSRRSYLASQETPPCTIIDAGHRRRMDVAVEVPKDELGAVATNAIWRDVYDRVADLVREHRSTLVFVNTRRLAERVAHNLEERLADLGPQAVAAHHGSLSRQIRLSAEERLKQGHTRVVVATASLELGIDIGAVDLVCQIGSPRSIAIGLQRIGRSGHWIGAVPKGRLFATTRDELIECAAIVRALKSGALDCVEVPSAPLDILAQQLVAEVAAQEWREEDLFSLVRGAYPYRDLSRRHFDEIVRLLANGMNTRRGRGRAYLYHDRINHRLRGRRGARLAAITSGGAIPETANYTVIAEPEGTVVGSVDEDFAVESLAGDIILLGNTSWRIRGVETGKMRVENAHGAPPTIPFWRGEAPSRTVELSAEVAALRAEIDRRLQAKSRTSSSPIAWLQEDCGLDLRGAEQAAAYIAAGRELLGAVPTQETVIAERFFDEGGGMQLVIHAPFGGRINRAWGMALRKRFCVTFDFELQAAATDEGLVISLGERHSFPLSSVFGLLQSESLREVVTQAILQAPMFTTRWRWNVTRALAVLRFEGGKRVPPQIQRMRAEDLLAAVFPDAVACQDNRQGPRAIPDHPLARETVRDCLTEAMDVEGLLTVLRKIEQGAVRCLTLDTPAPSVFSHEILNSNPYAYLDDAPLEERRARAVEMRRSLPPELAGNLGALSPGAIAEVAEESWPPVRDADELHDALLTLIWVPATHPFVEREGWARFLPVLLDTGRGAKGEVRGATGWVATERIEWVRAAFGGALFLSDGARRAGEEPPPDREEAVRAIIQGWMESTGPTTAAELSGTLSLADADVDMALAQLEAQGQVLRGSFRPSGQVRGSGFGVRGVDMNPDQSSLAPRTSHLAPTAPAEEWCDRRLLARIHRLTIGQLRREIEPVSATEFMRFLFQWQHVAPGARVHGDAGLLEIVRQLAGFEAAASGWERGLLPLRLAKYEPELLDRLCMSGAVMWGRLSPPGRVLGLPGSPDEPRRQRKTQPTSVIPISFFPREESEWLLHSQVRVGEVDPGSAGPAVLSPVAQDVVRSLRQHGASFFADLVRLTRRLPAEVEQGLWELAAVGLVTADGFDNLRALLDPRRRRAQGRERLRRPRHAAGRWSLLRVSGESPSTRHAGRSNGCREVGQSPAEPVARQLLRRYGVVFRDLLGRESVTLPWRELLMQYRRMEMQGAVRGGRFVSGFTGEQFALPEAVEALRALRKGPASAATLQEIRISAADPLNLVGVILPGPRVASVPTNYLVFRDGVMVRAGTLREAVSPPLHALPTGGSAAGQTS